MTKDQLMVLINEAVRKELRAIITPSLIKPLVQEAVAGALANLLAEGIVKGTTLPTKQVLKPNVVIKESAPELTRDEIRRRFLSEQESIRPNDSMSQNPLSSLLETTRPFSDDELTEGGPVQSVLDAARNPMINEQVDTSFLTKNYSAVLQKMNEKKR